MAIDTDYRNGYNVYIAIETVIRRGLAYDFIDCPQPRRADTGRIGPTGWCPAICGVRSRKWQDALPKTRHRHGSGQSTWLHNRRSVHRPQTQLTDNGMYPCLTPHGVCGLKQTNSVSRSTVAMWESVSPPRGVSGLKTPTPGGANQKAASAR